MKIENINKAVELKTLLDITTKALVDVDKMLELPNSKDKKEYIDGPYNLSIAEHDDGSGKSINLSRYFGNRNILEVIKAELERQVEYFKKEIESL